MKSWAAAGGLLALVLACGASCSSSDKPSQSGTAGTNDLGNAGQDDQADNGGTGGAGFVDCAQLAPQACALISDCAELMAVRLTSPPGSEEPVGCVPQSGCSEVNIHARDPQGQEWAFPTTCIPAGWVGEGGVGND